VASPIIRPCPSKPSIPSLSYFTFLNFFASPELQEKAGITGVLSGFFGLALLAYFPFHLRKSRKITT
jgi:hypothetical protein